jgi:dTDP-4-dehydrorhamnose reductase
MKILITGGSGLLGQYLNVVLSRNNKILTLYNTNLGNCGYFNSQKINLSDQKELHNIFNNFTPDIVIHTAAISHPILPKGVSSKDVYDINVTATKTIAELCDQFKSKLIYTSTDLVYADYRGSMLKEDAKLIPVSLYAETKLMGEIKIQQTFDNYIILRTALLFGFGLNHSQNHFQQMFRDLKQGKQVKLFEDQYRTPISLIEAVRIINELVDKNIKSEIINFGGIERVSRYELGESACGMTDYDITLLVKIRMDDLPNLPKVEDVSMDTTKLQSFGIKQKTIEEMILEIIRP